MKIILSANKVPFARGGAEYHIEGLQKALIDFGHQVELIRFPFKFSSPNHLQALMRHCEQLDFNQFDGRSVDQVISLQFPAWGVKHDNHRIWVMHQHRAVYDLYEEQRDAVELAILKENVQLFDDDVFRQAKKVFANSNNVADRLKLYNDVDALTLYHPPPNANNFYFEESWDYIFYPSRLESLKRQDLLIQAAEKLKSPIKIIIGGDGGQRLRYEALIKQKNLQDKVKLIGHFSDAEKYVLYARSLAVFFGPYDEDYGYITLEAMLSSKPVITCNDSGGALEFVQHGETGLIVDSDPESIADAIDQVYFDKAKSLEMGRAGKALFDSSGITWQSVCEQLLSNE